MKISNFNNEYLTLLLSKILQEEKKCLLMGNFSGNLLNTDTDPNVSDFYDIFAPNILQPTRLVKKPKTITDIF